jgi:hypothetical protein
MRRGCQIRSVRSSTDARNVDSGTSAALAAFTNFAASHSTHPGFNGYKKAADRRGRFAFVWFGFGEADHVRRGYIQ